MRKINKGVEPECLTQWKKSNPKSSYKDLEDKPEIRQAIRQSLLEEQYYLCAYCCKPLKHNEDCHNEHVEAQNTDPKRTLDYHNLVASCNTDKQCGKAHKSKQLYLTPLMLECETELKFKMSGKVEGLTERAKEMIDILNLGDNSDKNIALIEYRKQLINSLLRKSAIDKEEDKETLEMFIEDLQHPTNGKLQPFAPVVVNILRDWLKTK